MTEYLYYKEKVKYKKNCIPLSLTYNSYMAIEWNILAFLFYDIRSLLENTWVDL